MLSEKEIYVSTDVESDGPIPGPNSMLSLGSAAYDWQGTLIGTFYRTLECLPGAQPNPETMAWWEGHPEAWREATTGCEPPETVMQDYVEWLESLPGEPVFVAYPASFDWSMVYWYLIRFAGTSPFSFSALDIKTLALAHLREGFHPVRKSRMPDRWFEDAEPEMAHRALDDALAQGTLFFRLVEDLTETRSDGLMSP